MRPLDSQRQRIRRRLLTRLNKRQGQKHGGKQSEDGGNLYFDTDCIAFLDSKWLLSEKKVIVSSANIYFKNAENKELFPLKKAKNRGSSGSDWAKAYQAVKHDRVKHIDKANVKHLIRALAALYILNIYYKDEVFNLINSKDTDFSSNWSSLFDINIHSWNGNGRCGYIKNENFDERSGFTSLDQSTAKLRWTVSLVMPPI